MHSQLLVIYTINKLFIFSPSKAKTLKIRIILSTIFISLPFMVRAIFNFTKILFKFNSTFKFDSLANDDFNYPLFLIAFYLVVDILPMLVQMLLIRFVLYHDYHEHKQSILKQVQPKLSYSETTRFSWSRKGTYTNISTSRISINSYIEESFIDSEVSHNVFKIEKK